MNHKILILFLFFGISFGYSQEYSKNKIKKRVTELTERVIDTVYFDYKNGKKLKKPKLEFWLNDNVTGNVFSSDKNFSDNKMYSIFQKIFKKGKTSDFIKMYENENPSIRVYGFWALVKNKEYGKAEKIIELEKSKDANVYWNSAGCLVDSISTVDLMKKLIERMKKYGS